MIIIMKPVSFFIWLCVLKNGDTDVYWLSLSQLRSYFSSLIVCVSKS